MKYTSDILIKLPRDKVVALFDNPDNMKHWQPELISFEHVSGEPGNPGAKSRLKYKMGKREIEMIETIHVRNLPDQFDGTYDAKGVHNIIKNRFEVVDETTTRWITEQEFQFSGFMKLMAWIMPGAFKKQTMLYLTRFRDWAESAEI